LGFLGFCCWLWFALPGWWFCAACGLGFFFVGLRLVVSVCFCSGRRAVVPFLVASLVWLLPSVSAGVFLWVAVAIEPEFFCWVASASLVFACLVAALRPVALVPRAFAGKPPHKKSFDHV